MNPTSPGSLVGWLFVGGPVAVSGLIDLVGKEFGALGELPSLVASLQFFEATLDASA